MARVTSAFLKVLDDHSVFLLLKDMSVDTPSAVLNPCVTANATLGIDEACFSIVNLYYYPVLFYSIAWEAYWVCIYTFQISLKVLQLFKLYTHC